MERKANPSIYNDKQTEETLNNKKKKKKKYIKN